MSNKNLHLVLGFVLAAFVGLFWSFTSAISFKLEFWDYAKPERWWAIVQNMVPIHFTDNWNDFHGFIYFSDGIVDTSEEVWEARYRVAVRGGDSNDILECQKKVKWFYYNAERWERLWPLDGWYGGITAENWIYTRCRKEGYSSKMAACAEYQTEQDREDCENDVEKKFVDSYGYYWMVTHDADGQKFAIVAWINYFKKPTENWVTTWDKLSATFVRFANKYPVWFIYDVNGWLWFVWCELEAGNVLDILNKFNNWVPEVDWSKENWQKLFKWSWDSIGTDLLWAQLNCSNEWSAMNSLIKVIVDGLVGMNKGPDNKGIQWNQSNAKMQYFWSVSVNNMQLINYARQRAEVLCRGKWKSNYYAPGSDNIVCVSSTSPWSVIEAHTNETLIVKWWANVKIRDMVNFDSTDYYDVFVDEWNLLIETGATALTVFKKNWFKSINDLDDFKLAVNTAWGTNQEYSGDDVAAWRFVRWNFIVNWSIKPANGPSLENIYFFYGKLTSKDTVDDLEKTFAWRCNVWTGSDSQQVPCPGWRKRGGESWENPYQNASLVIIDQNYPSPLYE